VWGLDDPRAPHAQVARLGVVTGQARAAALEAVASQASVTARPAVT
jgi:hypothetical protein